VVKDAAEASMKDLSKRIDALEDAIGAAAMGVFDTPVSVTEEDGFASLEYGVQIMLSDLRELLAADRQKAQQIADQQAQIIEMQAGTLRKLSTPVIEVGDGVLLVPVIGDLDRQRLSDMQEKLLARIDKSQASHLIIDLTGVDVLESQAADELAGIVHSVALLGAETVVTGISPKIALSLVHSGIAMPDIQFMRTLKEGIGHCMRQVAAPRSSSGL
jgi:rsbT co-antagonist protein RsbR